MAQHPSQIRSQQITVGTGLHLFQASPKGLLLTDCKQRSGPRVCLTRAWDCQDQQEMVGSRLSSSPGQQPLTKWSGWRVDSVILPALSSSDAPTGAPAV